MAGKPQVTLTFAGDSSKLETAFSKVGASARTMDTDVGKASKSVGDSSSGFDRAGEAADSVDTKAMGFRDTMTGVQDTGKGLSQIMKGDLFNGFLTLGMGVGDLASGMFNFIIPAMKSMSLSMIGNATNAVRSTAALAANKVGMIASAVATNTMAVAQKALNLAMRANPIGLIITALVLLVAGIIYAYKHSETFRNVVDKAMKGIKTAFGWVLDKGGELVGWFKALPGKIGGFFGGLANVIKKPFTSAFQAIKDFWNSTVGGKGFSVPDWIPGVGGKDFHIPYFHQGGIVGGAPGTETLAMLQAGERVTPANRVTPDPGPAGDTIVYVTIDGQQLQGRIDKTVRTNNRELKRAVKAGV